MPIPNCPPGNTITDAKLCQYHKDLHKWMGEARAWMVDAHARLKKCCQESPEGKLSTEPTAMAMAKGTDPPGDPPKFPPD